MAVAFELPATRSAIRTATERLLAACNIGGTTINGEGSRFAVTTEGGTFLGVKPMVSALMGAAKDSPVLGTTTVEKVTVSQWVTTALQLDVQAMTVADVEPLVSSKGFLIGSNQPSAADLFLYCSVASEVQGAGPKAFPNLTSWMKSVEKSELVSPVKVSAPASGSPTSPQEGGKGKVKAVRPSDEAIAAMRAEKEAAKAAKKEKGDAEAGGEKKEKELKKTAKKSVNPGDLDLRIGKIIEVDQHPESDKLYVEKIDVGDADGPRTILSGLVQHVSKEQLLGCHCLVLCNLKPRSIGGVPSAGMVMCASNDSGLSVVTADGVAPGTPVVVGTSEVPATRPGIPSTKQMEELLKHFNTSVDGTVCWQEQPLLVSGQQKIVSSMPNATVK